MCTSTGSCSGQRCPIPWNWSSCELAAIGTENQTIALYKSIRVLTCLALSPAPLILCALCVSVCHIHVWALREQNGMLDPMELELQATVCCLPGQR